MMQLFLFVNYERASGDAVHEENIGADGATVANESFPTQNRGIRVNRDKISHCRVALAAFDDLAAVVLGKTPSAESDSMI